MKSPFPGMDPYIEACGRWAGFHGHLIEAVYQSIAEVLPAGYSVDTAERTYVVLMETEGKKERLANPDVTVTQPKAGKKSSKKKGGVAVAEPHEATEPVRMQAFIAEEFKERFIEIYAEEEERVLVTCIEVLSPTNKRPKSKGWRQYERKRRALLLGEANFIEIDLLRGGHKMPMLDTWPNSPYTLLVCRAVDAPDCRVWPASFRHRLPVIPVPLAEPDPDLSLDLQPLIDGIYALGRYHEWLDYTRQLTPTLSDTDAAWVKTLLKDRLPRPARKGKSS
jgi:hypothetical protein